MKRDTLILGIALGCGIVAFGLIFNYLKEASQPKNQFAMAKQAIAKGKVISVEDIVLSPPLKNIPVADYFTQMHEVLDMETQENIPKGRMIKRSSVKEPPPLPAASPSPKVEVEEKEVILPVPPSMRALTLSQAELENVPPILKAGAYVDILGSVIINNDEKEVRTLLSSVQVLSVQKNERKQIENVALALLPRQVETLLNASKSGRMRLVISQKPATDGPNEWNMGSIEVIRGVQRERKVS